MRRWCVTTILSLFSKKKNQKIQKKITSLQTEKSKNEKTKNKKNIGRYRTELRQ
jgi:hypothetical protein